MAESGSPGLPPGRARSALMAVAAQFWINGMIYAAFAPRLPEIRDRVGVDTAGLGLILTVGACGGFAASAGAEKLVMTAGTRRTILVGSALSLMVLPTIGLATGPIALAAALFAISLLDVLVDIAMNLQGSWLSARRSVPVMNRLHGLWSVGSVVGGLATIQTAALGLDLSTYLILVAVVLALALAFFGPRLLGADEYESDLTETQQRVDAAGAPSPTGSRSGRRFGAVAAFAIPGLAAILVEALSTEWATIRMVDDLGFSVSAATWGYVAVTVGMVIGRVGGDSVQSRFGARSLLLAAVAIGSVGIVWANLVPFDRLLSGGGGGGSLVAVTAVGYLLVGMGASVMFPQLYDLAARSMGGRGRGLGYLTAGIRIGALGGPVVVGALASGPFTVGQALALLTFPACLAVLLILRTARVSEPGCW